MNALPIVVYLVVVGYARSGTWTAMAPRRLGGLWRDAHRTTASTGKRCASPSTE